MNLRLHNKKGVNARMTFCPQCGGESSELLLIGAHDKIYTCASCGLQHIGKPKGNRCQGCGHWSVPFDRVLSDSERLPSTQPCDKCQENNKIVKEAVAYGGIHWTCSDCGSAGAIKAGSPLAQAVRNQMGIDPPLPCGVEFSKEDGCPVCGS